LETERLAETLQALVEERDSVSTPRSWWARQKSKVLRIDAATSRLVQ
jgi:hypothetical protein